MALAGAVITTDRRQNKAVTAPVGAPFTKVAARAAEATEAVGALHHSFAAAIDEMRVPSHYVSTTGRRLFSVIDIAMGRVLAVFELRLSRGSEKTAGRRIGCSACTITEAVAITDAISLAGLVIRGGGR